METQRHRSKGFIPMMAVYPYFLLCKQWGKPYCFFIFLYKKSNKIKFDFILIRYYNKKCNLLKIHYKKYNIKNALFLKHYL